MITMADGEVLKGEYRVAFGGGTAMAFAGTRLGVRHGHYRRSCAIRGDRAKTQVLCRGNSSTMGHGNGECQTYDGAVWAVSW